MEGGRSESNFSNGRAVRELTLAKPFFAAASSSWISKDWYVEESATKDDMDPRVWTGSRLRLRINTLGDPSDKPQLVYFELYSDNKRDHIITEADFGLTEGRRKLARSFNEASVVSARRKPKRRSLEISERPLIFSLFGRRIDENGYLVFCVEGSGFENITVGNGGEWGGECGGYLNDTALPHLFEDGLLSIVFGDLTDYPEGGYLTVDTFEQSSEVNRALQADVTPPRVGSKAERKGNGTIPIGECILFKEDGSFALKNTSTCAYQKFNPDDWDIEQNVNVTSDKMNPAGSGCNLIITELASPVDNTDARYVELFSDNCASETIGYNFKLVVIVAGSDIIPEEGIDLEGLKIGRDGFLVLCSTPEANDAYDNKCDYIVGRGTAVDNDGTKSIAIVYGPIIYDIYGEHCLDFDSSLQSLFSTSISLCNCHYYCFNSNQ